MGVLAQIHRHRVESRLQMAFVDAMSTRGNVSPSAPIANGAAVAKVTECPAGHPLKRLNIGFVPGTCDGCKTRMKVKEWVMDCRQCNWYLCQWCSPQDERQREPEKILTRLSNKAAEELADIRDATQPAAAFWHHWPLAAQWLRRRKPPTRKRSRSPQFPAPKEPRRRGGKRHSVASKPREATELTSAQRQSRTRWTTGQTVWIFWVWQLMAQRAL